jgi:hypothetical protein
VIVGSASGILAPAVALLFIVAGCKRTKQVRDQPETATIPAASETRIEGVAGTMGSDPGLMIAVRLSNGEQVLVNGPLAPEVGRLTGATLVLVGPVQATTPWRMIVPTGYEVLAIDGQKPQVGVLRVERNGGIWLETSPPIRLEGTPDALRAQNGAKVYVLGAVRNGVLMVQSFGVIRPPD